MKSESYMLSNVVIFVHILKKKKKNLNVQNIEEMKNKHLQM